MAYLHKGYRINTEADLYPAPPPPKDYVHDPRWGTRWFRLASRIWFMRLPVKARFVSTGEEVVLLSYRRTWWGAALRLQFGDGRIETGYDQSTVELL